MFLQAVEDSRSVEVFNKEIYLTKLAQVVAPWQEAEDISVSHGM